MIPGLRADKMFTFWKVLTKFCYQYEVHVRLVHAHLIHRPTASVITERVIFIVCVSHNVYHV